MAAAVVIGGVHAHACARDAVLAEADAGGNSALLERSIALIQVKLVGLGIIGHQNVGPAVAVVVENRDAQALRSRVSEPSFLGCIFELSTTQVMPQP